MNEWFNKVESTILSRPEVEHAVGGRVEEVNKVLSPTQVGGCFCKTFTLGIHPDSEPEPWNYDSLAATLETGIQSALSSVLTSGDEPIRTVTVEHTGHGEDRDIVVRAYIIPDPE